MSRRTFQEWLHELREIVHDQFELELDVLPEYDVSDARSYYKDRSPPSLYFKECLSEHLAHTDGVEADYTLREILKDDV